MLTITLLTIKEAMRRRVTIAGILMGLLLVSLLLLPRAFRGGGMSGVLPVELQVGLITTFGLGMVRFFGSVLGVVMASGSISAEVERGTLYAILSKPVGRIPILLGKWLGMVVLSLIYVTIWSVVVWLAVYLRDPASQHIAIMKAAMVSALYPVLFISLTLFFSTFAQTSFASALALIMAGVGWSEGIQRMVGTVTDTALLITGSKLAGYVVPMGRISRWVMSVSDVQLPMGIMGTGIVEQPPTTGVDIAYIFAYVGLVICLAAFVLKRRDL